ncbi:MAG: universal stress protein [Solirubrobacteraceae bacterium]
MFNNVVVGVGEHDSWHDAIALATQLVSTDGRLTLANIYVFDTEPRLSAGYTSEDEAVERRRAAELLQRARAEAGRPAAARWRGAPSVGRGLHELAEQLEADVLVVGTSRKGEVGRLLRGDNARATLNGTPCAVAVAPSGYARRVCAIERVGVCYDGSAQELARTSTNVDLLVVGSRRHGRLGRLVHPSRYRSLASLAQCPLLIVPRGVTPRPVCGPLASRATVG